MLYFFIKLSIYNIDNRFMIGQTQCGLLKYTYSLRICDYNLDVAKTEYLVCRLELL